MLRRALLTEEKETGTLSPLLFEDTVQRKPSAARKKATLAMGFVGSLVWSAVRSRCLAVKRPCLCCRVMNKDYDQSLGHPLTEGGEGPGTQGKGLGRQRGVSGDVERLLS